MIQVADASVVASMLISDDATGRWCEDRLAEHDLAAPHLMPFEVANVIRRTVARGALDGSAGTAALRDLARLPVDLIAFEPLAARTWKLRENLTVCDASYVAAAELLECRLLTLDARLAAAPGLACEILVAPPG